jgi:glycosyltransferase involved in cell wall biosynthesis
VADATPGGNIALDAGWCAVKVILSVEPVRFPLTGIGRYTYELACKLQCHSDIDALKLFSGKHYLPDLPVAEEQSSAVHGLKRIVQSSAALMELYRILMPVLRAQALRDDGDHLYHGPNFILPPFPGRSVATFHDLSPFTWAQCFPPERIRYLQKELRKTLDRADALITDSEFTRQELAVFSGVSLDRIHAVPLASSADFRPRSPVQLRDVLRIYGLQPGGYSLYVGTIEPRKNIVTLLDAYGRLPLALRQGWPLILSGYQGWQSEAIHARIDAAQREGWARYLGFIPSEHLPLLFSGARLFAFPSHYEGFGLPVLEAMSSGVPVICSNSSSLPEVVGGAALMCNPLDIDALTANLQRGLEDEVWRAMAIEQGLSHSASFSWERCAAQTVEVYKSVLDR